MEATLRGVSVRRLSVLTDETTSPERQQEANEAAARALSIDLADRQATDLGVSASKTSPFQRPELGEWLRRPDDFDVLLFWRFDRAVRSVADMHDLSKWGRAERKMIVFAEGPGGRLVLDFRNPLDPMATLMVTLFAWAAEMEAHAIRERVAGAQAAMRAMPLRWRGGRPLYGYMPEPLDGGGFTLVQDPEAVAVLERIIAALFKGESIAAISADLTADGVLTPANHRRAQAGRETKVNRWGRSVIVKLLTSFSLLGWKTHKGNPVRDSKGAPIMATNDPILTREEFDAVGAALAKVRMGPRSTQRTGALLNHVVYCGSCSSRMYLNITKGAYTCNAFARSERCAAPVAVKGEWIEEYAETEFLRRVGRLRVTETREIPGYDPAPEIAATTAEYEAHQEEKGRQRSKAAAKAWQARADALDARLVDLESREATPARTEVVKSGSTYADDWGRAGVDRRRAMLVEAGAKLVVQRGSRGTRRALDTSRVRFDLAEPFFAEAADELSAA